MTTVHVQLHGEHAVLPKSELERLLELAGRSETIQVDVGGDELTTADIMRLVESGGAFEFWNDAGEDIYTVHDGTPL